MKSNKNEFSITFYLEEERVLFLEYVNNTEKAIQWFESKGKHWSHCMIYNRKTRQKLERLINPKHIREIKKQG